MDRVRRNAIWLCIALGAAIVIPAYATETTQGTVMHAGGGQLRLKTMPVGEPAGFAVAPDAKITLDERPVRLEEIHMGDFAKVTTEEFGKRKIATMIQARTPF